MQDLTILENEILLNRLAKAMSSDSRKNKVWSFYITEISLFSDFFEEIIEQNNWNKTICLEEENML